MSLQRLYWRRQLWQLPSQCRSYAQAAAAATERAPIRSSQKAGDAFSIPILFSPEGNEYAKENGIHDRSDPKNNHRRLYSKSGLQLAWYTCQEKMLNTVTQKIAERGYEGSIKDLVIQTSRNPAEASLFNHASMAFNNDFFFKGIAPSPGVPIPTDLEAALKKDFSSLENLKQEMLAMAESMFGPGYVWLVRVNALDQRYVQGFKKFMLLNTYLAGSPLAGAHNRRQPIDMNTQNVDTAKAKGGMEGLSRSTQATLPQHTEVQNTVGSFGQYAGRTKNAPGYGGVNVEPLLCVSTWEHAYIWDWRWQKRGFLERWWQFIDWEHVSKLSGVEGDILQDRKRSFAGVQGNAMSRSWSR